MLPSDVLGERFPYLEYTVAFLLINASVEREVLEVSGLMED